mmetsp:Transcript_27198/g.108902  ORF Transcript_27198/g.108902 Transcript_27198/m.108902 type:complete len:238 (+) Transcript_27198:1722-2435(+)
MPETTSSMRRMSEAASTAVLSIWTLTANGSQTVRSSKSSCADVPNSARMSTSCPVVPSTPQPKPSAASRCFALSCVSTRTTLAPQFLARVRGTTSIALATAMIGNCKTPIAGSVAFVVSARCSAISVAPPPGSSLGSNTTFLTTCMASCRFRSTSLSTSLEPPRSRIVHALGSSQSSKNAKYSSPSFRTSKRPHFVPMSDSWISSGRDTTVAPTARATRLLSVLRSRRNAVMLAFMR